MSIDQQHSPVTSNSVHLCVVIPAAGLSTRLGRAKQQLPVADTTLLGHTIETAIQFINQTPELSQQRPIVVGNPHQNSLPPHAYDKSIIQLSNPKPEQGILSTLRCSQTATANADAVLVLLGDQYRVTSTALGALFYAYLEAPQKPIAAQYHTVADQFNQHLSQLNPAQPKPVSPKSPNDGPAHTKKPTEASNSITASGPVINLDDALLAPPMIWPRHYWQQLLTAEHPRAGQTLLHTSAARALPMPEAAFDVDTEYDVFLLDQWLRQEFTST